MAERMFIGDSNGKALCISDAYVGVNGKAAKVVKAYVGVNGKAQLVYSRPSLLDLFKSFMYNISIGGGSKYASTTLGSTAASITYVGEAIGNISNGLYSASTVSENVDALISDFKADCIAHGGNTLAEQRKFLADYCSIYVGNLDVGAIGGFDCGSGQQKTVNNIGCTNTTDTYSYDNSNYDAINTYDNTTGSSSPTTIDCYSTTIEGITFYWTESEWDNLSIGRSRIESFMAYLLNNWLPTAARYINENTGLSAGSSYSKLRNYKYTSGIKAIQITFVENRTSPMSSYSRIGFNGPKTIYAIPCLEVNVNKIPETIDLYGTTDDSNKTFSYYATRVLAETTCYCEINVFHKMPLVLREGIYKTIYGGDNDAYSEMLDLCNTSLSKEISSTTYTQSTLLDAVLDTSNNSFSYQNYYTAAGYMLIKYMLTKISRQSTQN